MPADPTDPIVWPPDLDPDTIPKVNPRDVARTEQDGKPTQWQLNWEQGTNAWFQKTVVDLNNRLTKVYSETDFAYAAVTTLAEAFTDFESAYAAYTVTVEARFVDNETEISEIISALSDGSGSYGSYILSIESEADNATASGQVYLQTKAAPTGSTAAYGWNLTSGSAYTGMEALALSGGGSAIGFTANQFRFVDSGTAKAVWAYSGGKHVFTGDVAIDGGLTINGTIVTGGAAANAFTQIAFAASGGTVTGVGVTVRTGAGVMIIASFNGQPGLYYPLGALPNTVSVLRNGVTIYSVGTSYEASGSGGSAGIAYLQTSVLCADYPSAGYQVYDVVSGNSSGVGGVSIAVLELAR